jgi:hypothetical protein
MALKRFIIRAGGVEMATRQEQHVFANVRRQVGTADMAQRNWNQEHEMKQKLKSVDPRTRPTRLGPTVIVVGLALGGVASWLVWAAKERTLEPRTRTRLQ